MNMYYFVTFSRHGLEFEAGNFYDKETGVLEAPMVIRVAEQTRPVPFMVSAVVTNSDLEFDVASIDFGHCTIYESTKSTIRLANKSILPQEFGFVGIPEVSCYSSTIVNLNFVFRHIYAN